jgi:hypothetical protein
MLMMPWVLVSSVPKKGRYGARNLGVGMSLGNRRIETLSHTPPAGAGGAYAMTVARPTASDDTQAM